MGDYKSMVSAMRMLGISRGSIYRYIAEGKLNAKKDTDVDDKVTFKFKQEELDRFGKILKKRWKIGQKLI